MLTLITDDNVLTVSVAGKLVRSDYETFVPRVNDLVERHGKVRILFEMHHFQGWTLSALWEDIKFDVKHFNDIERIAFVGETKWQKGMAAFCNPFTTAKIRYFETGHEAEAKAWLTS